MSLAIVHSRGLVGVSAPPVTVEVHLANGLPAFAIVGLAETEVKESRERVRAALQQAGFEFPNRRITVNLAPADLPKASGRFDLPVALGILGASGQLPATSLGGIEAIGELSLCGDLRPVRGALVSAIAAQQPGRALLLPADNADEAALAGAAPALACRTLADAVAHLAGRAAIAPHVLPAALAALAPTTGTGALPDDVPDLTDVIGQPQARRALEIAAAGGHGLLLVGPPGVGKSMLAQRLPGILPEPAPSEALEAAAVASLAGAFDARRWRVRPFRAPHHSASGIALVGGGNPPRPGEASLAHRGVLFLDELAEFDPRALDMLREPLETGAVHISRAGRHATFPARFQLVAASNPCPCGGAPDPSGPDRPCTCSPQRLARHRARLSGPLLDRIDLRVHMPARPAEVLRGPPGEASATVRARVVTARARMLARQHAPNHLLDPAGVARHCALDAAGQHLAEQAAIRLGLSSRGLHRVLRVARTVADLAGEASVAASHLAEALSYRPRSAA